MIAIDRETGTVTWDDFRLHPQLRHDEFAQLYPAIKPSLKMSYGGINRCSYKFSKTKLDDFLLTPIVHYENNWLSYISFGRKGRTKYAYHEQALWMEQLAEKINSYRRLLTSQFGPPSETNPPSPYIHYKFEWGEVRTGYAYDSSEHPHITSSSISITYDYHQQVNSWNKLALECDRLLQNEQKQNGTHVAHLLEARSLIDVLQSHFDFPKLKPFVTYNGFTFPLLERRVSIILDINPEDMTQRYKIWCQGEPEAEAIFVADGDNSRLVDELRLFLKNETL